MTIPNLIVRERHRSDLPILASALTRVYKKDGYPIEGVADPVGWLNHPYALVSWTALVNAKPVGQVTLAEPNSGDEAVQLWMNQTGGLPEDLMTIVRLFVDPSYRNSGAGRTLMLTALGHAREIGRTVVLDVLEKDESAIRLYGRLGGQSIGRVRHWYGDSKIAPAWVFSFGTTSE